MFNETWEIYVCIPRTMVPLEGRTERQTGIRAPCRFLVSSQSSPGSINHAAKDEV